MRAADRELIWSRLRAARERERARGDLGARPRGVLASRIALAVLSAAYAIACVHAGVLAILLVAARWVAGMAYPGGVGAWRFADAFAAGWGTVGVLALAAMLLRILAGILRRGSPHGAAARV
jgi:hypothetical protein